MGTERTINMSEVSNHVEVIPIELAQPLKAADGDAYVIAGKLVVCLPTLTLFLFRWHDHWGRRIRRMLCR